MIHNKRGLGLLLMVIVIAVSGLLVAGSTWALANQAAQTQLRIDETKAYYLAQAGIMRAIRNWYNVSVNHELGRTIAPINTTVTGNQIFKVGYEADATSILESNYAYIVPGISFVRNVVTATNTGNNSAMTVTVPAGAGTIPVGSLVVVSFAMDGGGGAWVGGVGTSGCRDSVGNTYVRAFAVASPADNNTGVKTVLWYSFLTTALANPNTITVDWTTNTADEAISVAQFSGLDTFEAQNTAGGSSTTPASANAAITKARSLIVGAIGVEGPSTETFTAGTNYLTNPPTRAGTTGGAAADITINPEYRVVSATGNYAANGTLSVSRDWVAGVATFYAANRWFTSGADRRLRGWQVYNRHASTAITLDQVKISWSPAGAELLNDFVVNGVSIWPGGTAANGATVNVTNTALSALSSWEGNNTYIQWNGAVNSGNPVTVSMQLIFSGDSATANDRTHDITMWNGNQAATTGTDPGMPSRRSRTITSTGQVNQTSGPNNFKVLQTIRAHVSGGPETSAAPAVPQVEIVEWEDEVKNIP